MPFLGFQAVLNTVSAINHDRIAPSHYEAVFQVPWNGQNKTRTCASFAYFILLMGLQSAGGACPSTGCSCGGMVNEGSWGYALILDCRRQHERRSGCVHWDCRHDDSMHVNTRALVWHIIMSAFPVRQRDCGELSHMTLSCKDAHLRVFQWHISARL